MITRFSLTEDLTDFVWHAACAAAEACGVGNPVTCLSRGRRGWAEALAARRVMLLLANKCILREPRHNVDDLVQVAIYCGKGKPAKLKHWHHPGCPFLAGLFGMDHSGIVRALQERRLAVKTLAAARRRLAEWYPAEPVMTVVRVEASR